MKIICLLSPTYDYLTASIIEGLLSLGHSIIASENSNYAKRYSDSYIKRNSENADLILCFSNKNVRYNLIKNCSNTFKIYIDGDDSQKFTVPRFIKFKAIFKRELNRYYPLNKMDPIFPLPFAAEKRYFNHPSVDRSITVSYVANMHSAFRYAVYECLKSKNIKNSFIGNTIEPIIKPKIKGCPSETPNFRNILFKSNISVNVIGGGYDCARYWEILSAGCLLISQKLDIVLPNPLIDGIHCFYFNSLDELSTKIDFLLDNRECVEKVSHEGYIHMLKYHTSLKRAEYLLSCISNLSPHSFCDSFFKEIKPKKFIFF